MYFNSTPPISINYLASGSSCGNSLMKAKKRKESKEAVSEQGRDRESENPGPNNPAHEPPLHCIESFGRPHTHDGSGDHVSGGERHAPHAGHLYDECRGGLRREAMNRLQTNELLPHRFDNSPSSRGDAGRHHKG